MKERLNSCIITLFEQSRILKLSVAAGVIIISFTIFNDNSPRMLILPCDALTPDYYEVVEQFSMSAIAKVCMIPDAPTNFCPGLMTGTSCKELLIDSPRRSFLTNK